MRHLGRYRLVRRLGTGAFATVWMARDDALDVTVAIKVLADNWSADADVRERFLAEARLLRRIDDPRVVGVHDIGTAEVDDDGASQPYFVMDYVEGGTLADVVADPPPVDEGIALAVQAALAVQVLHDHEIVHRDVKPSNLLLGRDDAGRPRVLVADLGMAKQLAEASGLTVTAGTPAWMAPEQVQGGDGFDARADVYAVAAVTHALLTGRPPFDHVSVRDVVRRTAPPVPFATALGLPAGVDALVVRSLSIDPGARPATARDFAEQLAAAAQTTSTAGGAADASWSGRLVAVAAGVVFLVALAATYAGLVLR